MNRSLGNTQRAGSRIAGLLKSVLTRQCPVNFSDCDSGPERLTHHLPGAVRPRFAWIESLERPERPTQTCGKHEGSLSELADSNCVDPAGLLLLRSLR